jgi:2-polyprenyl-6-methoxyphenol hydroxylase-like FAD-dependent oxidoreductase
MNKTPVLISGGGPAGLTLSLDLSKRGIKNILLNDRPESSEIPKLDIANPRTMEIMRRLGVADELRAVGLPTDKPTRATFNTGLNTPPLTSFGPGTSDVALTPYASVDDFNKSIRDHNDGTLPLEANAIVSQMYLEPVLKVAAESCEQADVRFGHALLDFEEHENGVKATVCNKATGEEYEIEADYLVACDGSQSLIRKKLGIALEGHEKIDEMSSFFIESEDLSNADPLGPPWHYISINPELSGLCVSLNVEKNYFNIHAPGHHESAEKALATFFGQPINFKLIKQFHWWVNLLVAEQYATDRVFLTGDAAHQYFPTFGLGFNTGVIDATNLAWKLAANIQGWGGKGLLRSYEQEQLPLGRARRDISGSGTMAAQRYGSEIRPEICDDTPEGEQHRAKIREMIENSHAAFYESLGVELGFRYTNSEAVIPDGTPEPPTDMKYYQPTTWPGARLPHVFLEDGSALFDRLGQTFTLIVCGELDSVALKPFEEAARAHNMPLEILALDEPLAAKILEYKYVLVRPDQHVAWRSDNTPENAEDIVARVTGN